MKRFITLTLLTLISFVLQTSIFSFHNLRGISPDLVLVLTMSFGIMRGRKEGMLVGLFGGFLFDVFYTEYLGMYMLIYMLVGYTNGLMHRSYLMEDMMLPVVIVAIDSYIINTIIYIASFLLRNKRSYGSYFIHTILPQMLLTTLATVIVYRIYVLINRKLKSKEKK